MADADRGASETLGVILMTAVVVTTVSVAGGAMLATNDASQQATASIEAVASSENLTIRHVAGEPLPTENLGVVLRPSGEELSPRDRLSIPDRFDDRDGAFEPGESWRFPVDEPASIDDVVLLYDGASRYVVDVDGVSLDEPTGETGAGEPGNGDGNGEESGGTGDDGDEKSGNGDERSDESDENGEGGDESEERGGESEDVDEDGDHDEDENDDDGEETNDGGSDDDDGENAEGDSAENNDGSEKDEDDTPETSDPPGQSGRSPGDGGAPVLAGSSPAVICVFRRPSIPP